MTSYLPPCLPFSCSPQSTQNSWVLSVKASPICLKSPLISPDGPLPYSGITAFKMACEALHDLPLPHASVTSPASSRVDIFAVPSVRNALPPNIKAHSLTFFGSSLKCHRPHHRSFSDHPNKRTTLSPALTILEFSSLQLSTRMSFCLPFYSQHLGWLALLEYLLNKRMK